jgi:hypothetical protein
LDIDLFKTPTSGLAFKDVKGHRADRLDTRLDQFEIDINHRGVQVLAGTGALVVSFDAGYRRVIISDKRSTRVESKSPYLFAKAEAFAAEVHAEHEPRRCGGRKKSNRGSATNSSGE